ncbi:MAG TPA: ABC transporter substrate-binding protein [Rugosimonospora sp.]|nr:ABC transporter substrate-binding protein [Rugosimonospora sp.]
MQVRRLATWTVLPVVAMIGLVACDSANPKSPAQNGDPNGVVSIGIAEPEHLIPSNTTDIYGGQVLQALFTPLVAYDRNAEPVMAQAASVTTADGRVWRIRLKPGYTFHNGEPVTVDSYIRAWNYGAYGPNGQNGNYYFSHIAGYAAMNPGGNRTPTAQELSGLKRLDDLTMQVTLSAPYSDFKSELGYNAFLPLPRAAFAADGSILKPFEDHLVGDGPFKMKGTWTHDQAIEVERYDAFPGEKPRSGGVLFKIYQDLGTAYDDVQTNTLDVLPTLATPNLATAAADFHDRYQHSPASSFEFLAFPTFDQKYADVNVRKAISMAIDRDGIVKTIFANSQSSARSFVSPVLQGYRDNTCGAACQYNPIAARQLYAASNGPADIKITYNADGGHREWVEAVCNQLHHNLGVTCVAAPQAKLADLLQKVQRKQSVGMFRLGWSMDYPSMEDYLTPLYSTHGAANYYGYSNPQFDQLVRQGSEQSTEDSAIRYYQRAEDLLARDLPVIPLRFKQNNYIFSTRVSNVSVDLFGYVDLTDITTSAA